MISYPLGTQEYPALDRGDGGGGITGSGVSSTTLSVLLMCLFEQAFQEP